MEELELILTKISSGEANVGTIQGRMLVAMACGYMDARGMVHFMETYGFPLSLSAIAGKKRGLKVDFPGLRYELERIGKKPETINSELKEVRYFMEQAA